MVRRYTLSAVMVAAAVGTVTLAGCDGAPERAGAAAGSTASAPAEMTCPESIPAVVVRGVPSVPEPPRGFDGRERLVPQDTPATAVVCRYATKPNSSPQRPEARDALNGSVRLSGDLGALARELAWTPHQDSSRGCTQVGGPKRGYLLGLTYGDGRRVWVGATEEANGGAGAGNGAFTTDAYLGGRLATAYRTRVWQDLVTPVTARPSARRVGGRTADASATPRSPAASPAGPPACPTRRSVPAATGVDPRDRLVPVTTPDAPVICAYGPTGQLVRAKPLISGFERLARDLPWLPRRTDALACVPNWTTPAGSAAASYLIGLRYGDGVLWLDAGSPPRGRRCTSATNGAFVARTSLYGAAAHAHAAGAWQGLGSSVAGRLGDDRVLVPAGVPATVTVWNGTRWGTATAAQAVAITRALRGVAVEPVSTGLSAWSGVTSGYGVSLDYGYGPSAALNLTGRTVTGAALRATLTPAQARGLVATLESALQHG